MALSATKLARIGGEPPGQQKNQEIKTMNTYQCTDGYSNSVEIEAESTAKAAQQYVDDGDWGVVESTIWVSVRVQEIDEDGAEIGDETSETISIDPDEPDCADFASEHDWQSPYKLLGGVKENPGVWGHGGGVTYTVVCGNCGAYKCVDTWAQNPENGEQGLESVEYKDADDISLAWIKPTYSYEVLHGVQAGTAIISVDATSESGRSASNAYTVYAGGKVELESTESSLDDDGMWPEIPQEYVDDALELAVAFEGVQG
jgi:hypothetical protein